MPADAGLARLIREYGQRWEVEHIERGAEWIACQADGHGFILVIAARDLPCLKFKIDQAEREDAGEQGAS